MAERFHIIGLGGAGMSGIARVLVAQGHAVSGSDARDSRRLTALAALGVRTFVGHRAEQIVGSTALIVSTAIPEDNVERLAAVAAGIPVLTRAEALAMIMEGYRGVAVSGTHGKTTTTSMVTVALQHAGADPSYVIGSELNESASNAHLGSGELFIAEADESDGSFLQIPATAGIVTNVEPDHLNYWGDFATLEQAFVDFGSAITARGGFLVVCADQVGSKALAATLAARGEDVRTYGTQPEVDLRLLNPTSVGGNWQFTPVVSGQDLGRLQLAVPGKHNALNAAAALLTGIGLGYSAAELMAGLSTFTGTRRRFEFKGEVAGVRIFDDYAHHPTEIAATLQAARDVVGAGRLVVAFQAHHYYRTALFSREFGEALGLADEVVVLEVFAPGETPIPGASGQTLAGNVPLAPACVHFEPSWSAVAPLLATCVQPGDVVMTLGAGDIGMIGGELAKILADRE
jgi:UDP-N-acetylmuramate--alanine ligase